MSDSYFPHQRLDVYALSLELARQCHRIVNELPRGYAKVADDLVRASQGIPLLIAEGANRHTDAQKRQRFGEARGETGECAAALELLAVLGAVGAERSQDAVELCQRMGAMLTKLVQRFG
jgi:four helix bundle protein